MLIDWFTVIAQVINFLILVWLLKRFLYKPILDAIDAREQRIAQTIAEADQKKRDAQRERDEFDRKNQELADERDALVSQMMKEVNAKRQKLLDDAQQAADAIRAKRHQALQREQKTFEDEIARWAQDQVFSISRKALRDLADTSLEEHITKVFISRVRELNDNAKQELAEALTSSSEPARVRSAFELSKEQQATIRQALNETFAADIPVRFEIAPNSIGGIELTSNGRKVAWSIDEYLSLLQKSIAELTDDEKKIKDGDGEADAEVESESPT
jgi:F-type H+-transporting ATPase subunit b